MGTTAGAGYAEKATAAVIEATSGEALLKAVISLTHGIHANNQTGHTFAADQLREQRRVAMNEILRRIGDAR